MPKSKSPLKEVQLEGDGLKKDIDEFLKECKEKLEDSGLRDRQTQMKNLFARCADLQKKVSKLETKAKKLKKSQEPVHINRYDEIKQDEVERITAFKDQLAKVNDTLKPDEVEESYFRRVKQDKAKDPTNQKKAAAKEKETEAIATRSDGDDDEEDEDDDDDEDEEEEEEGEDDDEDDDDDEYDDDIQIGAKPSVMQEHQVKAVNELDESEEGESYEETDDDDEVEEEEVDEEGDDLEETGASEDGDGALSDGEKVFEAVCDFDAEEPNDLAFRKGDVLTIISTRQDGWWMAEDEVGNKGLVPSTYLKLKKDYSDLRDVQTPEHEDNCYSESGKELWKSVRKSLTETSVTDVLSAMGAIPSGFRPSWTARLLKEDKYSLCSYLKPLLSDSRLMFKDLLWNPQENRLRHRPTRVQKMLQLMIVRNMPNMGVGLEARSRHVRIAVFDGEKILSNIHTVQATWNESDVKTWRFSPRVVGLMPSIMDGECFIRTDYSEKRIGLLFELCVSYVRTKTGECGEFGCGWVHLPLYDSSTGGPIINRVFDLPVKGGTPFEQDVEVDPSISRKAGNNKFRSMLSANKQPHLQIKLVTPTKEQKPLLETLPDTIVSSTSYLVFLSYYRKLLGDVLLRDRIDVYNTDLIHSPVLAGFPEATRYPDIMDALRSFWADKKRAVKRSDKRDGEQMKNLFNSVFMEIAYPLLYSATLPRYDWVDSTATQKRWEAISNFTKESKQKGILSTFLSPGKAHQPFDSSEVTFDLIGAYTKR